MTTDDFPLPPAATGQKVTVSFTAEQFAYIEAWIRREGKDPANLESLLHRFIMREALQDRRQALFEKCNSTVQEAMQQANNDQATVRKGFRRTRRQLLGGN